MKYAYTILYVEDVLMTVNFYQNAFGFKQKFITAEADYAELLSGETTLAFACFQLGNSNLKRGFQKPSVGEKPFAIELAFTTVNIETDIKQAIQAGAIEYEAITIKPWGQKVAYLKDINGFLIELCTPMNSSD